jgi:hypothetical protein
MAFGYERKIRKSFGRRQKMKLLADFFALIGLVSTIIVAGFYLGYTTYQPKCYTVASVFTKECK